MSKLSQVALGEVLAEERKECEHRNKGNCGVCTEKAKDNLAKMERVQKREKGIPIEGDNAKLKAEDELYVIKFAAKVSWIMADNKKVEPTEMLQKDENVKSVDRIHESLRYDNAKVNISENDANQNEKDVHVNGQDLIHKSVTDDLSQTSQPLAPVSADTTATNEANLKKPVAAKNEQLNAPVKKKIRNKISSLFHVHKKDHNKE
ncbi:uncharacterized protein LOC126836883 isoform X2 [Adelges cooleyi]|uniref:uncharacterized protein LOC126836883 isoform X2 n=1 Tax=Adelges cooleyi TaxID=133065 RepID=UPI002180368E|nr:uncharacterized protein LOC126836883 isoform X2 [Adelges cooleyi]